MMMRPIVGWGQENGSEFETYNKIDSGGSLWHGKWTRLEQSDNRWEQCLP